MPLEPFPNIGTISVLNSKNQPGPSKIEFRLLLNEVPPPTVLGGSRRVTRFDGRYDPDAAGGNRSWLDSEEAGGTIGAISVLSRL